MTILTRRLFNRTVAATALFCMATQTTFAALLNLAQAPLFIGSNAPPKVMLTISKDQQFYKKAYNDYSDLDADGQIETTYKHSVKYYGYFDSSKCYVYSTTSSRFDPQLPIAKDADGEFVTALCNNAATTNQWSGNFLNWVAMSRMDAVRKLLFGGLRIIDTATDTVLERAYIPTDAHAWAKYYNPDPAKGDAARADYEPPINKLTPFNPPTALVTSVQRTTAPVTIPSAGGDFGIQFLAAPTGFVVGDQIRMASATGYMVGPVVSISGTNLVTMRLDTSGLSGSGSSDTWNVTNLSATGISLCNLTTGDSSGGADSKSQTNTRAPLIRVAQGNFALWNANERWQCQWAVERSNLQGSAPGIRSNGNHVSLSEIAASAENPVQSVHGLGTGTAQGSIGSRGQFFARVAVCVTNTGLHGAEKCQQYPSANYKPIGLLQTYGETQRIHFGLITGSYTKNITGGVLRKNVTSFTDEVRSSTDGTFTSTAGIVKTLNAMRVYGYNYIDGTYIGASGDNCTYQLTDITEGACTSWGNPMSEVFFEAIRYYAGKQPSAAAQYTSAGSKDAALGLPLLSTWTDPLTAATYCAPLNVVVVNASVSTNDDDLRTRLATDINSSRTVGALTSALGDAEGITGGSYFTGKVNGVTSAADPSFELCTPKTITAFGEAAGICPEGSALKGSYLIAGVAHHARTNRIRSDLDASVPATNTKALKVTSYGVQLASNTPQLIIPVAGGSVVIQPLYRLLASTGGIGGGALVDLKYVRMSADGSSGKVYINWEDSEQGGDYDQDMWGTLEWVVDAAAKTITVTTNAISESTVNPQGFGYTISGTTKDGPHFASGMLGFNFNDPSGVRGCTNCQAATVMTGQRGPQAITYNLGATAASTLKDPLWYLAKYGGFNDGNGNKLPDTLPNTEEWDRENNRTGETTADGEPDNYFLVTNPIGLEAALLRAFTTIGQLASASSVTANSTSLKTGSAIYAARFDAKDWSGRLAAYMLTPEGVIETRSQWDAAEKLPAANDRVVLTYNDDPLVRGGVKFRWADLGAKLKTALKINPANSVSESDTRGQQRLNYLRGDATLEGAASTAFRRRPVTKLGDIVNSSPVFVGTIPDDPNRDTSYREFRDTFVKTPRKPMVYVGANDGMLHGFDATANASGGAELIAYIPSKIHGKLNLLTSPNYVHRYFVDSTPSVADVQLGANWKTVLVGGLAAGGQGIYALDVTHPEKFSESNPSTVLWEFHDSDDLPASGYAGHGLGYVFGQPMIRKMSNGKWAAIVAAGYNNSEADGYAGDGRGYIYIIFLNGPSGPNRTWVRNTDYVRLETTGGSPASPNALAQPFAADVNSDGMVDFIYAGDLLGQFWKFDVTDSTNLAPAGAKNAVNYADSANRVILYSGTQPITSQAQGTVHPTGQGYVLTFGTGRYIEAIDTTGPYAPQSFYGIWDKNNSPGNISAQTVYPTDRSKLFRQVIATTGGYRTVEPGPSQSSLVPDWSTHMGWFMDFPSSDITGERSVFTPLLVAGRLIFTTLVPSGGACEFGGTSYFMVISPVTGGRIEAPVLDVNADRVITAADTLPSGVYASGVQSAVGITPTPTVIAGRIANATTSVTVSADGVAQVRNNLSRRGNMIFGGSNGSTTDLPLGLGNDRGRVSWREVLHK